MDIIIQARMGSSRLPGKVMKYLKDKVVLQHIIDRLKNCKNIRNIIIATTTKKEDDLIYNYCNENSINCYRGSEKDVLKRYYDTALFYKSKYIVRVTSDCPLIDSKYVDLLINTFKDKKLKYLGPKYYGNHNFPDGFNCEVFPFELLKEAFYKADINEREHVTTYIIKKYKSIEYDYPINYNLYKKVDFSKLHLSLDTQDDYNLLDNIFRYVYSKNKNFSLENVLEYLNNTGN